MDLEDHLMLLIYALFALVVVFIVAFTIRFDELWVATMFAVIVVAGVIVILARWGGDIGETV